MTQAEWDELWWVVFGELSRAGFTQERAFARAHEVMNRNHGPRPKTEKSGPPFWVKLAAPVLGVPMDFLNKVWNWLNGRKLFLAALLAAVPVFVDTIRQVLEAGGVSTVGYEKVVVTVLAVVGVLHKVLKLLGVGLPPAEEPK